MQNIGIEIQNDVNQKIVFPIDPSESLNLNQNQKKKSFYIRWNKNVNQNLITFPFFLIQIPHSSQFIDTKIINSMSSYRRYNEITLNYLNRKLHFELNKFYFIFFLIKLINKSSSMIMSGYSYDEKVKVLLIINNMTSSTQIHNQIQLGIFNKTR